MITILDTDQNVTARLPQLKALGLAAIGRYLAFGLEKEAKVIKTPEARAMGAAGMPLFMLYEIGTHTASGAANGKRDGIYALDYAKTQLSMPERSAIIPCADYDAQASDYASIAAYFHEFNAAVSPYLRVGAYANGYTCNRLKADGLIEIRMLPCSKGFLGTRDAIANGAYEILQALPTPVAGLDTDPDTLHIANGDFGARVPFAPAAPVSPAAPPAAITAHASIAPVSLLARIEKEFGL
jgi:hypothetical protein